MTRPKTRLVPGINMLLALWMIGDDVFVLDVIFLQDESRHALVQNLLHRLDGAGLKPTEVIFHAWYAASKTLNLIQWKISRFN